MGITPSQQPLLSPEGLVANAKQSGAEPSRIQVVGNNPVQIEFQIEDLVSRFIQNASPNGDNYLVPSCAGCSSCSKEL